jgi:hypothetical protein
MRHFALIARRVIFPLAGLGTALAAQPVAAQTTAWQATTQPGGHKVARVAGSGIANGMALTCERGVPVLAVNLVTPAPTNPVQLTLDIDGQSYPVTFTRNGRTNVWVAAIRNSAPIDAMTAGSRLQLSTRGRAIGTMSTAGAREAITSALAGCYQPQADLPSSGMANAAPVTAGFGGVAEDVGCPSLGPVARWGAANVEEYNGSNSVFCGDFTGDGMPDAFAVIRFALGANNFGQEAVLFQNVGGQLRFMRRVPEFFGTPKAAKFAVGRVTLDITTMLPTDARCCPTGKETRQVDTTTGRHWQLVDAKPAALTGETTGPLSRLPIALGPYVAAAEACRAPTQVTWFEPAGYWEISSDSRFFSEIAEVTRDGADYLLKAKPDPSDPPPDPAGPDDSFVGLRPAGPGRIVMMIQDDVTLKLCKAADIPARLRP